MSNTIKTIEALVARVEELETRVTFQQETIDSLNQIVTDQWKLIDKADKKISSLDDQLYELEQAGGSAPVHQKPPHY